MPSLMPSIRLVCRHLAAAATAMAMSLGVSMTLATQAHAAYPDKTVRMIVPFSAGGASDIMGRLLAQKLSERWKQQVYVDNRPGAGGNIGMDAAAHAAPDGYTMVLMNNAAASNAAINPKLSFDVTRDLVPIALVASTPMVLVANPGVPASDMDELTALLKRQPGKFSYGSCGAGGPQNFATELYKYLAQVYIVHAPYRGCTQAAADLLGGQIELAMLSSSVALPYVKTGRMKALGTTVAHRLPEAPGVATFRESKVARLKDYEFDIWYGVMLPAGTDAAIVDKVRADINAVLDMPEVKQVMTDASIDSLRGSGDDLMRMLKSDIAKSAVVVKYSGFNQ